MSLRILGTGSALPEKRVTNEDLTRLVDTSDEWIVTRTGIRERRVQTSESLTELGAKAALAALENAGAEKESVDLVLCTTVRGDAVTPGQACLIERELGLHCPAFDINAACAGFVFALHLSAAYLATGAFRRILVISAESMSSLCDWTDRSTCVLFGDGAAAALLERGDSLVDIQLLCQPDGGELLYAGAPHGNSPFRLGEEKSPFLYMNGQEVYKFAVHASVDGLRALLEKNGVSPDQVDHYLLHQANYRILEAARTRLRQPREKFPLTLDGCGNTSSSSLPILLDSLNRSGKLKKGQLLAMSAFGAGLSAGTALLRWDKED